MKIFPKIRKNIFEKLLTRHVLSSNDHLGGVLSQLINDSSTESEYLSLFNVEESSTFTGHPECVFNPNESAWYQTNYTGTTPQWIQIEMKNIYLTITGYIIMTYDECCTYPRAWRLEGRNNENEEWQLIDLRSGITELNGKKRVKKILKMTIPSCTFRIFRLTITEDNDYNNVYLGLNEMDFIGKTSLSPNPKRTKNNCLTKVLPRRNSLVLVSLIIGLIATGNISKESSHDVQKKIE